MTKNLKKKSIIRCGVVPVALLCLVAAHATIFAEDLAISDETTTGITPLVTSKNLNVTLRSQQTSSWCWAASGQMCMEYLGKYVAQCSQANRYLGRTDCCNITLCPNPTTSHPCVSGGWPDFNYWGFNSTRTSDAALSWTTMWNQIYTLEKPVAFTWHWTGGGGHMMCARGVWSNGTPSTRYVLVNDPWSPCAGGTSWITYDYYVSSAGHHTHWDDFYNITKR